MYLSESSLSLLRNEENKNVVIELKIFLTVNPVMQDNFTVKRYKKNMKIFTFLFTFSVL